MRDRERQRHRQREKQVPCRELDVGLDPRTLGSHPGPKAGAKPLSHPAIPLTVSPDLFTLLWGTAFPVSSIFISYHCDHCGRLSLLRG